MQLKRNQPLLHDAMVKHTRQHAPFQTNTMHQCGKRNRIEKRVASVWSLQPGIGTELWHDHFTCLVQVRREIERFDPRQQCWIPSTETAYYLSDDSLSAEEANHVIRQHWGVENKIHYVRDTQLHEDASRIRCNPSIFGLLRSFALKLFRFNQEDNISRALYDNALNIDHLLGYAGL